jgi:hypothetical protein
MSMWRIRLIEIILTYPVDREYRIKTTLRLRSRLRLRLRKPVHPVPLGATGKEFFMSMCQNQEPTLQTLSRLLLIPDFLKSGFRYRYDDYN